MASAEAGVEAERATHLPSLVRYVPRGLALCERLPIRSRTMPWARYSMGLGPRMERSGS